MEISMENLNNDAGASAFWLVEREGLADKPANMAACRLTWFTFFNQPLISVPSTCTISTKRKTPH